LSKSILPKREPILAVARSASVTVLAAEIMTLFIAEDNRSVYSAETGIHFEHVIDAICRAAFAHYRGWGTFRSGLQTGCPGQPTFLHCQHAQNCFHHARSAKRVAQHAFGTADGRAGVSENVPQRGGFHSVIEWGAGAMGIDIVDFVGVQT